MPPDNTDQPLRLGALIAEGYAAPRRSMARVLALRPDEGERLLMVGIGIVVSALGFALIGRPETEAGPGGVILGYVAAVVMGLFQYFLFSFLVGLLSRAAGGTGDRDTDRTVVAWWSLVTAPLPVVMMAMLRNGGESPMAALVLLVCAILTLVLLAAYVAEGHGFRSTGRVIGAMFVILMIFSFVVSSIVPMPMPA